MSESVRMLVVCAAALWVYAAPLSADPAPLSIYGAPLSIRAASSSSAKVWRVLGCASVGIGSDRVTIHVPAGKSSELRAIKLQVRGTIAPLRIGRVRIRFASGRTQEAEIEAVISAGGETRTIDLDGAGVTGVEIDYASSVVSASAPRIARLTLVGRS